MSVFFKSQEKIKKPNLMPLKNQIGYSLLGLGMLIGLALPSASWGQTNIFVPKEEVSLPMPPMPPVFEKAKPARTPKTTGTSVVKHSTKPEISVKQENCAIKVKDKALNIPAHGGTFYLEIGKDSCRGLMAMTNASWVDVSLESNQVKVEAEINELYENRYAKITLAYKKIRQEITVLQRSLPKGYVVMTETEKKPVPAVEPVSVPKLETFKEEDKPSLAEKMELDRVEAKVNKIKNNTFVEAPKPEISDPLQAEAGGTDKVDHAVEIKPQLQPDPDTPSPPVKSATKKKVKIIGEKYAPTNTK